MSTDVSSFGEGKSLESVSRKATGRPPDLTPRQAQVLLLATAGLSDKEIARRLGVSHRTVRTHFEHLFRTHGIRNRSQAVALWLGRPAPASQQSPADECPYPKPFPPDFADCPAYQATQFFSLDLSHRPVGSFWTCRHLESRRSEDAGQRWYGACGLGDAEARLSWSEAVGVDRLQEIGALRQEVSSLSRPYVERLWEIQNQQPPPDASEAAGEMKLVADRFMSSLAQRLTEREALLDHLHLPMEAVLQLVRVAIDRFAAEGLPETAWKVPEEVLNLFPEEVRPYFEPGYEAAPSRTVPRRSKDG